MGFLARWTDRLKASAAQRRERRLFNFLVSEGVELLTAKERFAVPFDMLGSEAAVVQFTNNLSMKMNICVRASLSRGLCFVYSDGDEDVGTEVTIIGVKR